MKLPSIIVYAAGMLLFADRLVPERMEAQRVQPLDLFFAALAEVESGGDSSAYNKAEDAVGLYQIRPIYVRDVNRIVGHGAFTLRDRWDAVKSRCMVIIYLSHYGTEQRLGRAPTFLDLARIHNGGPNGWKKKATLAYAEKFERAWNGN